MNDAVLLISTIVTALTSVVAVIISIVTIRQSNKIQEEATRPDINISYENINFGKVYGHFIIKNSGKTGAKITRFEHDVKFIEKETPCNTLIYRLVKRTEEAFEYVEGLYLAPNQKFLFLYVNPETEEDLIKFKITYESSTTQYVSESTMRLINYYNMPELLAHAERKNGEENYERAIANILKEISTKRL